MNLPNLVTTMKAHGCDIHEMIACDGIDKLVAGQMSRFTAHELFEEWAADPDDARELKAIYAEHRGRMLVEPAPENVDE